MLDLLYILIRVPVGVVFSTALLGYILLSFVIETAIVITTFPVAVLILPRKKFSETWYASYPNTLKTSLWNRIPEIWQWVFLREEELEGAKNVQKWVYIVIVLIGTGLFILFMSRLER